MVPDAFLCRRERRPSAAGRLTPYLTDLTPRVALQPWRPERERRRVMLSAGDLGMGPRERVDAGGVA